MTVEKRMQIKVVYKHIVIRNFMQNFMLVLLMKLLKF